MKRIIKLNKRVISLFLTVMMIYSMAFSGITVFAATGPTLTLTPSTTSLTSGNVTITANASNCSRGVNWIQLPEGVKSYNGATASYTASVNGTYTFTVKDKSGNTGTKSITVNNIDNTSPTLTLTANTTAVTNGSVTITANASDNIAVASITKPNNTIVTGSSTNYTVTSNGTYAFKATDTAGNVITKNIIVSNIAVQSNASTAIASTPQCTVKIDSHTPTNPGVGDEITFNGTIYPQDFEMPIPSKEIVLVLDSSGSMGDNSKLTNLKAAAKNFITKMKDVQNLKIGIVDFDTQAVLGSNLIDASNVNVLNSAIDNLRAEGGTNTGEGLRLGAYLLSNSPEQTSTASKTIVFMSDGEPTYYNVKGQSTSGAWVSGTFTGTYYTYPNNGHSINYGSYSSMPSGYKTGPYTGNYTGYRYVEGQTSYYTDITKPSRDSDVTIQGSGYTDSDIDGYCLTYAETIGAIIKDKGYNAFSIGYGLTESGNTKMKQIHDSMSSVSSNFFESDTGSIDSVFNSIANTIIASYPITNVNFNFNPSTNSNIESVDGNTINLPDFNYRILSQTSSTVRYTADPVPFAVKIKSHVAGNDIPVFTSSTVTFPWKSNTVTGTIQEQYIDIGNVDSTPPTLTLTASTTANTNQGVVITASANDNIAVASITTPDNNIVQFNPTVATNSTTYTATINGDYIFKATDTSGNVTTKTITISNIVSVANVESKPKFTVTMDSYTPINPSVGEQIIFNGTIHPQDFQILIPAKEIVLVLDSSGSMGDNSKLTNLKVAAKNFITKMKDVQNLKIGIVDFDTQAVCGSTLIDASNSTVLNSAIDNLYAEGGTNTGEGLRLGAYLLSNSPEQTSTASKTIVFMSDGIPTYYNKKGQSSYYTDITKSGRDSDVTRNGTGYSDDDGNCLDYAKTVGAIIRDRGYNAFSIGYGLNEAGTAKMQQIHDSMSSVGSNFFKSDTGSIDSVFNSIANTILASYPITNVNFNSGTDTNIESIDGNTINLPDFNYRILSQTSSTVKYTADPVSFTIKIKSNIAGNKIPVFTNSTVTFPWESETVTGNVPIQYINVGNIVSTDSTPPTLILTPSTTASTNQDVVITASASDNIAVASITTPDNTANFNPTVATNSTTYTATINGDYKFTATDTAGNVTTQTITISNIDKTPPVITIGSYNTNPTNHDITVTATTNEGTLNANSYTFTTNGSYTFTATDSAGNTTSKEVTITNIDKIAPTLTLTITTLNATNGTVTITATAIDSGSGVASITKPDTSIDNFTTYTVSANATYTGNANGTYSFTASDNAGNITTQSISYEKSNILYHGLYNGNGTNITENNEFTVSNKIPITLAMIVEAKSLNPVIKWSSDKTKIPQEQIVFKKYEIENDMIKGSPESVTFNNSEAINLTGLTMESGKKYMIVYTITPVGSGKVTVIATADEASTKAVNLNIGDEPDLF